MDNRKKQFSKIEIQTSSNFRFFSVFQHSGDSILLFPLFLLIFFSTSGQLKIWAGTVLAGMATTGLVVFVFKQIFRKERPAGNAGKMYRKYDRFSFPSGHAARAWAIALMTAFFYWPMAIVLSLWAALISYSRLKLKLHDIPDVSVGVVIGILIGTFSAWAGLRFGFHW